MTNIIVDKLDGISDDNQQAIYEAMRTCSNAQRLCVCLYFMYDLPDEQHSLSNISSNLAKIFPPSVPHGNTPESYKDFDATTIRQYFNYETGAVKNGEIDEAQRLWTKPQRGCWRNTEIGNSYAIQTLSARGVTVYKRGEQQTPSVQPQDTSKRRYLGEDDALTSLRKSRKQSTTIEQDVEEDFPAIMHNIANLMTRMGDKAHSDSADSPVLHVSGPPSLIANLLTSQEKKSSMALNSLSIQAKDGLWHVELKFTK